MYKTGRFLHDYEDIKLMKDFHISRTRSYSRIKQL